MTLEEKIARVIDPQAFDPESGIYINSAGVHLVESRRSDQQSALQKAKAILSLLPNTGEREKALEEMEERAKELAESGEQQAAAELEYWIEQFSTIKNTNPGAEHE